MVSAEELTGSDEELLTSSGQPITNTEELITELNRIMAATDEEILAEAKDSKEYSDSETDTEEIE